MEDSAKNRLGGWVASNTASALWTCILGIGLTLFLLPINSDYFILNLLVPVLAVAAALLWRRRWLTAILLGLAGTLIVNTLLPVVIGHGDIYFVRCSDPIACARSTTVEEAGKRGTIYPVVDPAKWWIWSRIAQRNDRFRMIESGVLPSGEIVLHSPFERALAALEGPNETGIYADGEMEIAIGTLSIDARLHGGRRWGPVFEYGVADKKILIWSTPIDLNSLGAFSSVGMKGDFLNLARETVATDLQARGLLRGEWRETIAAIESTRKRSLRQRVRDDLIMNSLIDKSLSGNVFSLERLAALKRALPPLILLHDERSRSDPLLAASVSGHANMLRDPEGPPSRPAADHHYHPLDVERFRETTLALFALATSLEERPDGSSTDAERALAAQDKWIRQLRGRPPVPAIDPKSALAMFERPVRHGPFTRDNFNPAFLATVLSKAPDKAARDRILYDALHQVRGEMGTFMSEYVEIASGNPKTTGTALRSLYEKHRRAYLEMAPSLKRAADGATPAAREIIVEELEAIAGTVHRMNFFTTMEKGEEALLQFFSPEDRSVMVLLSGLEKGTPPSPEVIAYNGPCEWYQPEFRDHLVLFYYVLHATDPEQRHFWKVALPVLWDDFSLGGRCPRFVPGVMLLHAALTISEDERALQTRIQVDDLVEADAGWLEALYQSVGRAGAYEGNNRWQRLEMLPSDRRAGRGS